MVRVPSSRIARQRVIREPIKKLIEVLREGRRVVVVVVVAVGKERCKRKVGSPSF